MRIPTYGGTMLHFSDVARACARRVIATAVQERGDEWEELPEDHTVERKWQELRRSSITRVMRSRRNVLGPDAMLSDAEIGADGAGSIGRKPYGIQHIYAARAISDTFRCWRFRWKLASAMAELEQVLEEEGGETEEDREDQNEDGYFEGEEVMRGGAAAAGYGQTPLGMH